MPLISARNRPTISSPPSIWRWRPVSRNACRICCRARWCRRRGRRTMPASRPAGEDRPVWVVDPLDAPRICLGLSAVLHHRGARHRARRLGGSTTPSRAPRGGGAWRRASWAAQLRWPARQSPRHERRHLRLQVPGQRRLSEIWGAGGVAWPLLQCAPGSGRKSGPASPGRCAFRPSIPRLNTWEHAAGWPAAREPAAPGTMHDAALQARRPARALVAPDGVPAGPPGCA